MVAKKSSEIRPDTLLTSHQAGKLLQVNPSSINNWVKATHLTAFRTPGGHRRIRAGDLVKFLSSQEMPIPDNLAGAARRRLLWVQADKIPLRAMARKFAKHEAFVDAVFVDNAVHALVQFGLTRPHVVVFEENLSGLDVYNAAKCLRTLETEHTSAHQMFFLFDTQTLTPRGERVAADVGAVAIERDEAFKVVSAALEL